MQVQSQSYDMDTDETSDVSFDSDQIDSDIEAELYSTIHHDLISAANLTETIADDNSDAKQNSSIKIISSEENGIVEEEFSSNVEFNMSFGSSFKKGENKEKQIAQNGVGLKRKSSFIAKVLDDIQVQTESPSKKQKSGNGVNRTRHCTSTTENVTIEISDSDSDSVIFYESDESLNLQTNIETYVVSEASSDSDCVLTFLNQNSGDLDANQNRNESWSGNYKDVWKINEADLYRSNRRATGRYHENAVANCSNCNKKGHIAKFCVEPKVMKCILCGGKHLFSHCKRRICTKCFRFGHDSRQCRFSSQTLLCTICNMRGHGRKHCPDLWRRYHLTTSGSRIVKGPFLKQTTPVFCCNCGIEGHFGFQCTSYRNDRWSFPTFTSVISYERPEEFESFQRAMNMGRNIPTSSYNHPPVRTCQDAANLNPDNSKRLNVLMKRRIKKLKRKIKKSTRNAASNECVRVQPEVNSSSLSSRNFGRKNVHIKQERDFSITNASPPQNTKSKNIKQEDRHLKNVRRKNRRKLLRNQRQAMQNRT